MSEGEVKVASTELKYTPLDEIVTIHNTLRNEFRKGRTRDIAFRKAQLSQFAHMLNDNKDRIAEALKLDLGKSSFESYFFEVVIALQEAVNAYKNIEKWARDERADFRIDTFPLSPKIRKEPKGVILNIAAYNYPIFIGLSPLAGAIAAGNAVVLKPSEININFSTLLAEIFPKYLDPALYRVVNGGIPETTKLLELQWDHILYTGNQRVARIVATAAAKHLTPVTLELGGKNPTFVHSSCNLKVAARRIAWGRFANAGQTCVAPDYILIMEDTKEKFVAELKEAYNEFYPEGPLKSDSFARMGSITHFKRVKALLDDTKGEIVLGGGTDEAQRYIAPTVVKDVSLEDSLMGDEIFGPVLPIMTVKDMDEAIAYVNNRDHPLALYVFAGDSALRKKIADSTQSGAVICNDVLLQTSTDGLPFGGVGSSGYGAHTGKFSFNTFTHQRSTLYSPDLLEPLLKARYPPYTPKKERAMALTITPPKLPPRVGATGERKSSLARWLSVILCVLVAAGIGAQLTSSSNGFASSAPSKIPVLGAILRFLRLSRG